MRLGLTSWPRRADGPFSYLRPRHARRAVGARTQLRPNESARAPAPSYLAPSAAHPARRPARHHRRRRALTEAPSAAMLLLFETAAGYALFKVLKEDRIEAAESLDDDFGTLDKAKKVRDKRG